ncbi:MAG: DUF2470 domain-containing protein [Polyangiaceae bacterium]
MTALAPAPTAPPRTPSHAERCRTLLSRARHGTLCTHARDPAGYPFGSLVALACDGRGHPVFLLSGLAEHTRNLTASPQASVLVLGGGPASGPTPDPLASPRATLIGECTPVAEEGFARFARETFLAAHPSAATYATFKDFAMYMLVPTAVRYVGGFGRMSWIDQADYLAAEADPLAASADGILEHMNDDHPDAVLAYARALAGIDDVSRALMVDIDRYGFDLLALTPEGDRRTRIPFDTDVTSSEEARQALIALVKTARTRLAPHP